MKNNNTFQLTSNIKANRIEKQQYIPDGIEYQGELE
jgi:hypothetical protein